MKCYLLGWGSPDDHSVSLLTDEDCDAVNRDQLVAICNEWSSWTYNSPELLAVFDEPPTWCVDHVNDWSWTEFLEAFEKEKERRADRLARRPSITFAAGPVVEVPSEVPTIAEAVEKLGLEGGTVVVLPGHVETVKAKP